MEHLKKVDWQAIASYSNRIFLIDKGKPEEYNVLENRNKQDFDNVEMYVDEDTDKDTVTCYKILERVADKRKNLILFVEREEKFEIESNG